MKNLDKKTLCPYIMFQKLPFSKLPFSEILPESYACNIVIFGILKVLKSATKILKIGLLVHMPKNHYKYAFCMYMCMGGNPRTLKFKFYQIYRTILYAWTSVMPSYGQVSRENLSQTILCLFTVLLIPAVYL